MKTEKEIRLGWVKLYQQTKNIELVCLKCGITRPTLRKWVRCYEEEGEAGLEELSRKPHSSPAKKVFEKQEQWILALRKRRLGVRRIQSELIRLHDCKLSQATIHKILTKNTAEPLVKSHKPRKTKHRYSRSIPGERVQIDTCQIATGLYQYTAIDDCTRYRVLALYSGKRERNCAEGS
jgi:transposase-like protein